MDNSWCSYHIDNTQFFLNALWKNNFATMFRLVSWVAFFKKSDRKLKRSFLYFHIMYTFEELMRFSRSTTSFQITLQYQAFVLVHFWCFPCLFTLIVSCAINDHCSGLINLIAIHNHMVVQNHFDPL